jgi:hypothetical protein
LNIDYLFEILMDGKGQFLSLQSKGDEGEVIKTDVQLWDSQIAVDIGVNHGRINHVDNNERYAS